MLARGGRRPEKQPRSGSFIKAVCAQCIAAVRVADRDLYGQVFTLHPGVAGDDLAVRHIVHQTVLAGDVLGQISGAGKVLAVLDKIDLRGAEGKAAVAHGDGLRARKLKQPEGPVKEILTAGLPAYPLTVDRQVQILRNPVRVAFGQPESDGVGSRVSRGLVTEAAVIGRIAVGQDCTQTREYIIVVDQLAVYTGVGGVIRIVLAGLETVRYLAGTRDPVCRSLQIDPGSGSVVGLKVRIHRGGRDDRVICIYSRSKQGTE